MLDVNAFNNALREIDSAEIEQLVKNHLVSGNKALDILNKGVLKAMDIVGDEFKRDEIFIPNVLLAARNLNKALEILHPYLSGGAIGRSGTFVIGTVAGDLHDIGKNIVIIMLQALGFKVIDLGIDVPKEKFVASIDLYNPDLIGISALLTTTMNEMKQVIMALKNAKGDQIPPVIVGGAPINQHFADSIGAAGYGKDAVSGAELALKIVKQKRHID